MWIAVVITVGAFGFVIGYTYPVTIERIASGEVSAVGLPVSETNNSIFSDVTIEVSEDILAAINLATKEQFMQVTGVGETYAQNIIDHRTDIGGFSSASQLLDVTGIGENRLEAIVQHFSAVVLNEPSTPEDVITSDKPDINHATKDQLMQVSGIGETYAQNILDYRDKIGRFSSMEQLLEVSGIGESRLKKLKEHFTVK